MTTADSTPTQSTSKSTRSLLDCLLQPVFRPPIAVLPKTCGESFTTAICSATSVVPGKAQQLDGYCTTKLTTR